ncbi:MAG: OmpA family protein [Spirochaetales bacterium]|jgi:outer membrane protein OmpA-like peptidoglycan-associated protein|nr:OmpA family protein [Spirochaetales bacterium]
MIKTKKTDSYFRNSGHWKKTRFFFCLVYGLFFAPCSTQAQNFLPQGEAPEVYRIIEMHNFRKRENGKYIGAAYREIRGTLRRGGKNVDGGFVYTGRFYVLEETKRAARLAAAPVDESFPAEVSLNPFGAVEAGSPGRFPTMRSFPALPREAIRVGANWQAPAERILDPLFSGSITPAPVYVDYTYTGPGEYKGFPGHYLKAKYAIRYHGGESAAADLDEASGVHEANIFLPSEAGGPRLISETFKEQYRYRGGRELSLEGTVLTFFEGVVPLDRPETLNRVARLLPAKVPAGDIPGIEVESRPEGVALTVNNLLFEADSARLLPSENARLDALAQTLLSLPDRNFLVVGHAADLGKPAGEKQLSLERARAISEALEKRGVPPGRLLYEGRGSSQPVAPNTSGEGRARNRRVEIIILEG